MQIEYLIESQEHMANCWAAAQQGAFSHLRVDWEEISKAEFSDALLTALSQTSHEAVLAFVPWEKGRRAVALFAWTGEGRQIQPQVVWFPWASPRNKLEATLKFLDDARRGERLVLWFVREKDEQFMRHLCFYGMLRFAGKVEQFYDNMKDALLFYSRARWGL